MSAASSLLKPADALPLPVLRASVRRVPLAGESQTVCAPEGGSLADLVALAFPDAFLRRFVVAFVDGDEAPPEAWESLRPTEGTLINLCIRPGDGGEDGNKLLRTILQIAVVAASAWVGGMIGGFWGAVASAAISIGGNLAINSLIPLEPLRAQGQAPEPFYTVTGARNQARIYQPVSFVLGKHRFFPPLYGQYVQETRGNDVYLRVPFCLGPAPVSVSDLKIGDTLLSAFTGVEIEQRLTATAPGHTLYTGDPVQDAVGAKLTTSFQLRTTALDVDEIQVVLGFRGGLGGFDSKNRKTARTVNVEVRYRPSGSTEAWQSYRPTVPQANTASASAGYPFRPNYFLTEPDLTDYVTGIVGIGGVPSGPVAITRADPGRHFQFPVRFAVPRHPAGYDVEVRRTTAEITDPSAGVDSVWWEILGSLKTFVNPFPETGLASIVLRIKASEQLSGVIDTFNCVVEPQVPKFSAAAKATPSTATAASLTTTGVSRNPAEIVLNLYRGAQAMRPRADSRIDWPAWAAFAAFCETNTLRYDEVIEANIGRGELARRICASSYARPMKWAGKLSVVIDRDRGAEAPAQVFTPRNVSNLRWRKTFAPDVHAVRIAFNNAANLWQADETTLYLDGYSVANATKIETLPLAGKTDADEVRTVGRRFVNNSLRQTETFTFDMDAEALTCRPGAYAVLLHDAIATGLGAHRVVSVATSGPNVTSFILDVAIPTDVADTLAARWRKADGAGGFTVAAEAGVTRDGANEARFVFGAPQLIATAPAVGDVVLIGRATEVALPVLVRDIAPDYNHRASITVVPYAPERFTAGGALPPHTPMVTLPAGGRPPAPVQLSTTATSKDIALAFSQAAAPRGVTLVGFETAVREVGNTDDSWQDRGPLPADARVFVAPPGNPGYFYDLRVVAVGRDNGGLPVKSDPLLVLNVAAATVPPAPAGCNASFTMRTSAAGVEQLVLSCDWDAEEDPDVLDTRVEMLVSTGPDVWAEIGQARAASGATEIHGLQVGRDYQIGFTHLSRRGIASARTLVSLITAIDIFSATNSQVPAGSNGLVDTAFRFQSAYWGKDSQTGSTAFSVSVSTGGLRKSVITGTGITVGGGNYVRHLTTPQQTAFQCKAGDVVGARILAGGTNISQLQFLIAFRNAAGSALAFVGASGAALVSSGILTGAGEETDFNELWVVGTAPAGTVFATIDLRGIASSSAPVLRIAKPLLARLPAGQTVVPLFHPGRDHELGANVTETRVASGITGQDWGATAAQTSIDNALLTPQITSLQSEVMPTRPAVGQDFTGAAAGGSGTPTTIAILTAGSVVNVANEGNVREFASLQHIANRGWLPVVSNRTYRLTFRARVTVDGTDNRLFYGFTTYAADGTFLATLNFAAADAAHTVADGWVTHTFTITGAAILVAQATAAWVRGRVSGGRNLAGTYSGATWQLAILQLERLTRLADGSLVREDGTTALSDANVVTVLGVSAAITAQGNQATANAGLGNTASRPASPPSWSWYANTQTAKLQLFITGTGWVDVASLNEALAIARTNNFVKLKLGAGTNTTNSVSFTASGGSGSGYTFAHELFITNTTGPTASISSSSGSPITVSATGVVGDAVTGFVVTTVTDSLSGQFALTSPVALTWEI